MSYQVRKHYPHSLGLSAAFRQHKAASHCKFVHGYALAFTLIFECDTLDARNWVIDFGDLKDLKKYLEQTFDHQLLVARDDPFLQHFLDLDRLGAVRVTVVERVGCESFAEQFGKFVAHRLQMTQPIVRLVSAECAEHEGNSAIWTPPGIDGRTAG